MVFSSPREYSPISALKLRGKVPGGRFVWVNYDHDVLFSGFKDEFKSRVSKPRDVHIIKDTNILMVLMIQMVYKCLLSKY